MSIRTDCWSLDVAFYKWAAKRLTCYLKDTDSPPGHPCDRTNEEWTATVTEMRDAFQDATDSDATLCAPSPRLRKALKTWAVELPHLWT